MDSYDYSYCFGHIFLHMWFDLLFLLFYFQISTFYKKKDINGVRFHFYNLYGGLRYVILYRESKKI